LGTNAAVPMPERAPSAQVLDTSDELFLIDCGEGTQTRLSQCRIRRSRINHIFISHLHGDHLFGLPGLITSFNLFRREDPLHIYGPPGLRHFIETVNEATGLYLQYDLAIHEHDTSEKLKILETDYAKVFTIPLDHRVPTAGFLFKEKAILRRINKEAIQEYNVPYSKMQSLQQGLDWHRDDGTKVPNVKLTLPGRDPLSFAYCSDTRFFPQIAPQIKNVNLLYHETTFANDLADEAHKRGHSTSVEAGTIAQMAHAKQLVIGHFSTRYKDLSILLEEARSRFSNTILAQEGMVIDIT